MPNSKSIVNSQLSNSQFPLRHRIIPTTSPWVATQYAFYAQPAAFEDTMFQYGLHHVLAARGCEPTRRRRQRRDTIPVEIHRQQKHLSYNRLDHNPNLYTLHLTLYTPYTPQGLPHGFLYHAVWLLGFIYIVERYLVVSFSQEPFVQSIRLAH